MKRSVLIVVAGDPRLSAQPAEAVRIAAGLSANGRLDVTLCLRGEAVLALGSDSEDLADGDHFARYLPVVVEMGRLVFLPTNSHETAVSEPPSVPARRISEAELETLKANSNRVLQF